MAVMHNIFLTGLSGSGKSTVGRILAQLLNRPFFNIDALIEQECGERISTIFAHYGEEYFRSCESRLLAQVAKTEENAVIATGGGVVAPCDDTLIDVFDAVGDPLPTEPAAPIEATFPKRSAKFLVAHEPAKLRAQDLRVARLEEQPVLTVPEGLLVDRKA